jgi:superfamily II DNA or RNA helicase
METSLPLRNYQINSVDKILTFFRSGSKNILAQQPTGAGKSLIIAAVAEWAVSQGFRVLLVAHKIELITQLADHVNHWLGIDAGIIANKSRYKRDFEAQVQVGSIQALTRFKPETLPQAELVIFDEAHHCSARTYSKLFEYYKESYILGVTATPARIDGRGLRKLFDGVDGFEELILGVPTVDLIKDGYLTPFKIFAASNLVDTKGLHTRAGDYIQSELEERVNQTILYGDLVETWKKHANGKRTIVYPVSVKLSKEYCQAYNQAGIPAAHIDADTPYDLRSQILKDFRDGKVLVLCQHSIVVEGVDIPSIEAVQFARPTKSLVTWFQAIGRSLRPAPNKEHAIIIDHTENHLNLLWPTDQIGWGLDAVSLPKKRKGCLKCESCSHIWQWTLTESMRGFSVCPNCEEKHYFQGSKGSKAEALDRKVHTCKRAIDLIGREPNPKIMEQVEELIKIAKERKYKKGWVGYKVLEIPNISYPELVEVAALLNYLPGWAFARFQELQGKRIA